jgi:hypothetical protein
VTGYRLDDWSLILYWASVFFVLTMPRSDLVHIQRPPQWQGLSPWLQSGHLRAASAHDNVLCFTSIPYAPFWCGAEDQGWLKLYNLHAFPCVCVCMPRCMHVCVCVCVYVCLNVTKNWVFHIPLHSSQCL